MDPTINQRVFSVISNVLDVPEVDLKDGTSCHEIPAWDSLGIVKLAMAIEAEFSITVTADEAMEFTSVNNISVIVRGKIKG